MARPTAKRLAENCNIPEQLIRGVLRQLGGGAEAWDSLRDVANHGADGGFPGFTYYADTVGFFKRYRREIASLAEEMADDLGENVSEMVAGFNCLGGRERRSALTEYLPSVNRCLYGGRVADDDTDVANAMAWFALEEVARSAEDMDA